MKIFAIVTTDSVGWDEYDSIIVIAASRGKATEIALVACDNFEMGKLNIEEIGTANENQIEGVVIASFNAG